MKAQEKTAEQIINDLYWLRFGQTHCTFIESYGINSAGHFNLIIEAMKEFAQSRTEQLQKENTELARDVRNLLECQGVQKVTYENLTDENAQLKQENERLRGTKWIPIDEGLPKDGQIVVVHHCDSSWLPAIARYRGNHARPFVISMGQDWSLSSVTHWMPLPAAPLPQEGSSGHDN